MEDLLQAVKAAGEPTRLRILLVVDRCELTVTELCRVLGQTQPRVSRHLRLLTEAGLLERHAQGTSAYFRPARSGLGRRVLDALLPLVDAEDGAESPDGVRQRDLKRLASIRQERAVAASAYFEEVASDWNRMRNLHVSDDAVEAAMLDAVGDLSIGALLDIGTGTGRMLEVFAAQIDRGVGIDMSKQMLDLARSRLDELGHRHCAVRQGDVYDLSVETGSIDVAVLHHVLHFLDDPDGGIEEAARTVRANGRLLIVDFAAHELDHLHDDYAHRWLGFDDATVVDWCTAAGFVDVQVQHLRPKNAGPDSLTTTIWCATQRSDAPSLHSLQAVS